ncbi:MAG: hypothetical protein BGO74_10610 [Burkholderiales bacterium 68-12]|nr:MAG: hypothetical protein BGO74_10610 [Burkholderiales bacterium 68-12]
MNDVLAGLTRFLVRLVLLAAGLVFFLSLLAAALVLALVWGLRLLWARLTGRAVAPWPARIDPRTAWTTVYRSSSRWSGARRPGADAEARSDTPAHLRPLPGAEDVTDVQIKPPQRGPEG